MLHDDVIRWRVGEAQHKTGPCELIHQAAMDTPTLPLRFETRTEHHTLLEPLLMEEVRAQISVRFA